MTIFKLLPICSLLFLAACGDNSSSASSDDPENTSSSSEETSISSSSTKGVSSSTTKDVSSSSAKGISSSSTKGKSSSSNKNLSSSSKQISSSSEALADPLEIFKTRVPQKDVYTCSMDDGYISMKQSFEQRDFICSFKYDGREGFIYAQASPTSCIQSMGLDPVYSTDTAVMYIGGKYTPITDLVYDVGGNHRNDNFRFTFEGKVYEYDHSSYGWGYRKCHTMDCLRVYEADGETEILDGCASFDEDLNNVRKLPIVCRFADEEGKFDDFTDTFEICEGDFRLQ